jgi:hypothetical protein
VPSNRFLYRVNDNTYDPQWTRGDQPVEVPLSEQLAGVGKFGVGVGAAAFLGGRKYASGKLGWDYLLHAVRAAEEYSPGRVLRTFQASHLLSGLESASRQYRYFDPKALRALMDTKTGVGLEWLDHLSRLTGRNMMADDILNQGFRFERGRLLLGETGSEVLLKHAAIVRWPTGAGARFQEAYARSLAGGPLDKLADTFSHRVAFKTAAGELQDEVFTIVGGHTRRQAAKRFASGYGTALIERFNQLARAPFELPVVSDVLNKVPVVNRLKLDVVPSSGLKTLGKLTAKLGIAAPAMYLAYQQLDYEARNAEVLDNTLFGEGLTAGFATIWTRSQLATSRIADMAGLHDFRERQEEIAPGSTSLGTLAAFPIMGAAAGSGIGYIQRIRQQLKLRRAGLTLEQASTAMDAESKIFSSLLYKGRLPEKGLEGLDPKGLAMLSARAEKQLSGISGRVARRIAERQKAGGALGWTARKLGKIGPNKMRTLAGIAAGTALIAPFIPGALIPETRTDELEALYSGKKKVAVRKGRFWEFGRSPYEGKRIDRYKEHWYPSMLARAKEKSIWGEDTPGPLERWYKENFTYELEEKHYKDRPYPVTGTAFEDVPFLGPVLGATIGRFFKPPVEMHTEEWKRSAGGEAQTLEPQPRFGQTKIPGELEQGSPISPYGTKGVAGEQIYRMTEMIGLPGFTATAIKEAITGRADTFDQEMQLESARRMYGAEREYWDKDLGGGLGTTELVRRLYPHRRRQIELYNPIRNTMPEWLPGPGEKSPDFLHGDPYVKIKGGESRLPGAGYAALHPELEGVDPADYPAIHRFSILSDVAPHSSKYKDALIAVRTAVKRGQLSEEEIAFYNETLEQNKAKKVRREFSSYQYRDRARTPIEDMLATSNNQAKAPGADRSWFERTMGSYWETLTHNAETPAEYLTPISPAAKLVHQRTAVEDYAKNQVWGTENAFWGSPVRDFAKPFITSTAHALGWEGIPESVQEKRDLEEYFDILKYVKYTGLERAAEAEGDSAAASEFESKRRETLFGINPYTYNFSHVFRSLPRRDRDYFNAFIEADAEERAEIMKMIPENEQALMLARWKLKDAGDLQKAIDKGLLNETQLEKAEQVLGKLYEERADEGMPKNTELWQEYITTRLPGESYPDWYRRVKLLEKKLAGRALPGPDWVGWHPAVDLDDIKMKIVQDEARNAYDYDLWPDRAKALARRPQVAAAAEELEEPMDPAELRSNISAVLASNGIQTSYIALIPVDNGETTISMDISQDRSESDRVAIRRMLE